MTQTVKCRVCGKDYVPCKSAKYNPLVFNWREVACSPQCGQTYLAQIIASRTPKTDPVAKRVRRKPVEVVPDEVKDINIEVQADEA